MGALHDGHLDLVTAGHEAADAVVVSIFVNPLQFGEALDFDAYPRPLDDDLAACHALGVDAVYVPTAPTMYPDGFDTRVVAGRLATAMEGRHRPGHFDGVVTVVTKLFAAVRPDVAVFGEKDYQQFVIVRRLAADLDLGVEIVGRRTVRERDGLALSSRNRRLTVDQRRAAVVVPDAIVAAQTAARFPGATVEAIRSAASDVLDSEPSAEVEYVEVFSPDDLAPIVELPTDPSGVLPLGRARLAIAARFGDVRLIDNADLAAHLRP
jgi:pantoate--beta-alanine ligase